MQLQISFLSLLNSHFAHAARRLCDYFIINQFRYHTQDWQIDLLYRKQTLPLERTNDSKRRRSNELQGNGNVRVNWQFSHCILASIHIYNMNTSHRTFVMAVHSDIIAANRVNSTQSKQNDASPWKAIKNVSIYCAIKSINTRLLFVS